jgi:hypothetical protein
MKNMQWHSVKILLLILTGFIFFIHNPARAQQSTFRLRQADSLFQAKQYTQSLELYQTMFEQGQYTPAMLLKMAYIEEGLAQTGRALYHLNLYYKATNDKTTLEKMEQLATKYNLEGYEQDEASVILSYYNDYYFIISIALAAVLFLTAVAAFFQTRKKSRPIALSVLMIIWIGALAIHLNLGDQFNTGIISNPRTYAMSGPSSGAPVTAVLTAGHRVEIIGKKDVWLKIRWDGETVYVKQGNVLEVSL